MTALDQTAPEQHHADELSLAVQHALNTAPAVGAEHALGWLSDHMSGVGGVSAPLLPDVLDEFRLEVARLNAELTRLDREASAGEHERQDLAAERDALRDEVRTLKTDIRHRAALAIEWGDLQDAISAVPGMPADAVRDVLDAVRTAVTR